MKGEGPIPTGTYTIHPQVSNGTITDFENGTCGARAIAQGYQKINVGNFRPSPDPTWVYNEPCPSASGLGADCWGNERIKIEGRARVKDPAGKTVTRGGFYIHGGVKNFAASSGCIKVTNDRVFDHIRQMPGAVKLVVGDSTSYPGFIGPLQY